MAENSFQFLDRRVQYAFTVIVSLILSHLDFIENGFSLTFNFASFAINCIYITIALLIFNKIIEFLDHRIPWANGSKNRIFWQISSTILIYFFIQSIIIFGIEPRISQYSGTPFRIIFTYTIGIFLVIILNLLYLISYFKHKRKEKEKADAAAIDHSQFLHGTKKGKKVAIPKSSFLLFYIDAGIVFGIIDKHQKIILKESLSELEKTLDTSQFFRANRKQIISKKAVEKVEFTINESGNGIVKLDFTTEEVSISRRRMSLFKKWL